MRNWSTVLEYISCKVVCAIAVLLLAAFTYWAGMYTHMTYVDLENLKVRLYEDSMLLNVCWLLFSAAVLFFISNMVLTSNEEVNQKRVRFIAILAAVFVGIVGVVWVTINDYVPYHDQLQIVMDAMDFLEGNYKDLKGYLEIYPHQIGLVFLYKILFSIWPDYEAISYFHVIWLMAIVYFTYAVSEELFENSRISLYSIIGTVLFVPMYFYVNYAYGDLCMAACSVLGIWCLIKFCKKSFLKYAVFLMGIMTLGYLARTNVMIVIIAMMLTLLVYGISKRDWRMLIVSAALLLVPLGTAKTITAYYEHKADVEMLSGSPASLHIAMGMQDTYEGPGYYNAYNVMTYVNSGKDAEKSAAIAKEYISGRIQEMAQDVSYTKQFYLTKAMQQWNEPSFSGEISTKTFSESPGGVVQSIYFGKGQEILRSFRNRYLFVLYAGAFAGALCNLAASGEKDSIWKKLIFVILIGGFLFSLLWENKSRYVMPYVVMLLPYSIYGIYQIQIIIGRAAQFLMKKTVLKKNSMGVM